jgi:integrase
MTKVKLRRKAITQGRLTLYLDYYPPIPNPDTGKLTRREFLGLYIYEDPKSKLDKNYNKDTLTLAENVRTARQLEVNQRQFSFLSSIKQNTGLIAYYIEQGRKRKGSNRDIWQSSLYYLEQFFGEATKVSELTVNTCNDYKDYLLTVKSNRSKKKSLSGNTALSYFNKLKAVLKQAYKDELLKTDLNARIQPIKATETKREFLTLEELQALYNTECSLPVMKKAAIFSALTGLRFSDILQLTWGDLQHSKAAGYYIQFRQQKTKGVEVLPIPEQALQLIGDRGQGSDLVFRELEYSATNNAILRDWVSAAGITKYITFHCFRHTFATLQLSLGTDIYTVSKLLGHRELKTTQIYAKVVDKAKREAANRIKLDFDAINRE